MKQKTIQKSTDVGRLRTLLAAAHEREKLSVFEPRGLFDSEGSEVALRDVPTEKAVKAFGTAVEIASAIVDARARRDIEVVAGLEAGLREIADAVGSSYIIDNGDYDATRRKGYVSPFGLNAVSALENLFGRVKEALSEPS